MAARKILYLASKNSHKLKELQDIIGQDVWDLRLGAELDPAISWEESGSSFLENARIKALAVRRYTNEAVLADDSGLAVDYLDGAPGIYSSRFAGEGQDSHANNLKLLAELKGVATHERGGHFISCLVFIDSEGSEYHFTGTVKGRILAEPQGHNGFGYDPLFYLEDRGKTMAELNSVEKNQISHRAQALAAWMQRFG